MECLIIDDDIQFSNDLKDIILKEYAFKYNVDINIDVINHDFDHIQINKHYNLLLCDLILEKRSGIDIGKELFASNTIDDISYISSNNNLIFDVLPYNPLFFVRKSNLKTDLEIMMNLFFKKYQSKKYITIKSKGNSTKILESSIMYYEFNSRKLDIHTNNELYYHSESLKDFLVKLDHSKFVQVNKYTVINLDYLSSYNANNVYMKDGYEIIIGRAYKEQFKEKYMEYYL